MIVSLCKFDIVPGTNDSRRFVEKLIELREKENGDNIFKNRSLQRILEYMMMELEYLKYFFFIMYLLYLASIMLHPVIWPEDPWLIVLWTGYQIFVEIKEFCRTENKMDYFEDMDNCIDQICIVLQVIYSVILTKWGNTYVAVNIYTAIILLVWFDLPQKL